MKEKRERLYDFMVRFYESDEVFQRFKEKFPKMLEFSKEVKVIPWREEFAIADRDPEVIDVLAEMEKDFKRGKITEKEYVERLKELLPLGKVVSKTEGISFMDEKEVSFRSEKPGFALILHELGHVYFRERDDVWNARHGGGEWLMWLMLKGKIEGEKRKNEEIVKSYVKLLRELSKNPVKVAEVLNRAARNVSKKYGLSVKNAAGLALWNGCILSCVGKEGVLEPEKCSDDLDRQSCFEFLVNALSGTEYGDFLWKECLNELVSILKSGNRLKSSLRIV